MPLTAGDTRLDRTVAVKVLLEHIDHREDRRARIEREARAVASLNHPSICTLDDIGPGYMVMQLIEGESLMPPTGPTAPASPTGMAGSHLLRSIDT